MITTDIECRMALLDAEAAALISELCATIDAVQNELLACRAIACNSRIDAMLTAALSRAKGAK